MIAVAGLAPVTDLAEASRSEAGADAVRAFLGAKAPAERYAEASPATQLPLGVAQLILHGDLDDQVSLDMSRAYVAKACAGDGHLALSVLTGGGHMDFLDPSGQAHRTLCRWLRQWVYPAEG